MNRATHIIWRCWQDHVAYDPARHHALQRILTNPTAPIQAA